MDATEIPEFLANLRENWAKLRREFRITRSRWFGLGRAILIVSEHRAALAKLAMARYLDAEIEVVGTTKATGALNSTTLLVQQAWFPPYLVPVDDVQLELDNSHFPCRVADPGFSKRLVDELNIQIDDRVTFRLMSINPNPNSLTLRFALGKYSDYLNSCEILTWELALAMRQQFASLQGTMEVKIGQHLEIEPQLKFRQAIDPFDLSNRSAAAGINTLTILAGASSAEHRFLLHRRRSDLAEAAGTVHVVPSGMFQPMNQSNAFSTTEFSIRRNILREFGEEMLDKEALILELGSVRPNQPFDEDPDLDALRTLFETSGAGIWFLGVGYDPVSLKPEILTLLVIDDNRRERSGIKYKANWEGQYEVCQFSREVLERKLREPNLMAAGSACLQRTLELFDQVNEAIETVS